MAFCVFIPYRSKLRMRVINKFLPAPYRSKLRMRVINKFERRQQSEDDCLCIFVHGNVLLPWVYDKHA